VRIAALYDIHGNLPALEAVLADALRLGVDYLVMGGDVVVGPMSRDVIAFLQAQGLPGQFIRGNAEQAVLDEINGREPKVPPAIRNVLRWEAEQVGDYEYMFDDWPRTKLIEVDSLGSVLFCHATPRDDTEIFIKSTPESVLLPLFEPLGVPLVVCGHTHMQFDRMVGTTRVVNAGSVGMPFSEPGAYWLLLGPDVELRHTPYDYEKAASRIRATQYPQAEEFAANNVLRPPTEATMLELFAGYSIK
jgi:putative phosphoesterase